MEISNPDVAYNYQSKHPLPLPPTKVTSPHNVGDMKFSLQTQNHGTIWLLCDGSPFDPVAYPALYQLIGTSFGFSGGLPLLPDMRGRVAGAIGLGTGLTPRTLGQIVGTETHTLTTQEMPIHNHTGTTDLGGLHNHTINDPGHVHNYLQITNNTGSGALDDAGGGGNTSTTTSNTTGITINNNGTHSHTFTTQNTGGGLPHNNMQPTLFVGNYFIFAQ